MHTHNSLHALLRQIGQNWLVAPGDTFLVPSPIGHIGGSIYVFEAPLLLGTRAVLMERWEPDEGVALALAERCTHLAGATPFLEALLAASQRAHTRLPDLKLFICGGASVPPSLVRAGLGVLRPYRGYARLWLHRSARHHRRCALPGPCGPRCCNRRPPGNRRGDAGRRRRNPRARAADAGRLCPCSRRGGRVRRSRILPHRRPWPVDSRRLPGSDRAQQGRHHPPRREYFAQGNRGLARATSPQCAKWRWSACPIRVPASGRWQWW